MKKVQIEQNAIGYVLARLLDTTPGDSDDVFKLTIKEVFTVCREKFCSINGAPISRLVDEILIKERTMLAQAETKNVLATYAKAKFAHIQPIIQQQTVQVEIEPRPTRCRAHLGTWTIRICWISMDKYGYPWICLDSTDIFWEFRETYQYRISV